MLLIENRSHRPAANITLRGRRVNAPHQDWGEASMSAQKQGEEPCLFTNNRITCIKNPEEPIFVKSPRTSKFIEVAGRRTMRESTVFLSYSTEQLKAEFLKNTIYKSSVWILGQCLKHVQELYAGNYDTQRKNKESQVNGETHLRSGIGRHSTVKT